MQINGHFLRLTIHLKSSITLLIEIQTRQINRHITRTKTPFQEILQVTPSYKILISL